MTKRSRIVVLALGATALAATTALAQQFVSYGNALDRNLGVNSGGSNSYTGRTIRSSASGMSRDSYSVNRASGNYQYYGGGGGIDAPRYSVPESYGGINGLSYQGMNKWSKPGTSTGYTTGLAQPGYSPQLFEPGGGRGYSRGPNSISNSARSGGGGGSPPPRPGATPVSQSGETYTSAAASNVTYGRTMAVQRYRVPLGNVAQGDVDVIDKLDAQY